MSLSFCGDLCGAGTAQTSPITTQTCQTGQCHSAYNFLSRDTWMVLISLRIRGPPPLWLPCQQGLAVRNLRGQETVPRPECWWPAMGMSIVYTPWYQQDSLTLCSVRRPVSSHNSPSPPLGQPASQPAPSPARPFGWPHSVASLGLISSSSTRPLLSNLTSPRQNLKNHPHPSHLGRISHSLSLFSNYLIAQSCSTMSVLS